MDDDAGVSGSRILVVSGVPADLDLLCQALGAAGYRVMAASSGEAALELAGFSPPDVVLLDAVLPRLDGFATCRLLRQREGTRAVPVVFLTDKGEMARSIEVVRAGGADYISRPFQSDEVLARLQIQLERFRLPGELAGLKAASGVQVGELANRYATLEEQARELVERNRALEAAVGQLQALNQERDRLAGRLSLADQREVQRWGLGEFVGQSQTLKNILDDLDLLQNAQTTSVLILGESGTGKELIARAIHAGSARAEGPFVPVNCASLPRELADSLLFGHVRGAFTGAGRDQAGYFELAHGGTLFLDEVGLMPLELQPKLLRVLEDRAIFSLGARQPKQVDVRMLAATNVDLQTQIQAGTFRQDLYFRLARFTVQVPPLRERREDIGLLARHFLQVFALEMGIVNPALSQEAVVLLEQYDFPGNIRELKNLVERALIESRGGEVRPEHLHLPEAAPSLASLTAALADLPLNLAQAERFLIERAVEKAKGNISEAARLLGVERTKIYRRLRKDRRPPPAG